MRILVLGNVDTVFTSQFVIELSKRGLLVHLFDPLKATLYDQNLKRLVLFKQPPRFLDRIPKLGYAIKLLLSKHHFHKFFQKYDLCHIHYNYKLYSDISRTIRKIAPHLVISIYGSDFLRRTLFQKKKQTKIYEKADLIAFLTEQTRVHFLDFYGEEFRQKTRILRLGLRVLDFMDKICEETIIESRKTLDIDPNSIVTVCGYNSLSEQNHKPLIKSLLELKREIPKNALFIFPLTYGDSKTREEVKSLLKESNLNVLFFEQFMNDEEVARLRRATDIMINVQQTDHLSGSFLEHLYARSIVICGSWLPYDILVDKGVFFLTVDSPQEIGRKIIEVLTHIEELRKKTAKNPQLVTDISRWDINMKKWIQAYKELIEE